MTGQSKSTPEISLSVTQKVIVGVFIGSLMLMVGMLFDNRTSIAGLSTDNAVLKSEIRHLRELVEGQMDDRFRGADAKAWFALRDARAAELAREIEALKKRVDKLEGR